MVSTSLAGFYSGAGFSNIFSTPSYQTSVVSAYETTLGSTDSGYYTKTGRAFPDVSAQGSLQEVVASGSAELGTFLVVSSRLTILADNTLFLCYVVYSWWNILLSTHCRVRLDPLERPSHQSGQGHRRLGEPHLLR